MKKIVFLISVALCVMAVGCRQSDAVAPVAYYAIEQHQPFLGETWIEDSDFEKGNDFLLRMHNGDILGGCSVFRNGRYQARNLDWYIRDYGMLVVHIPAAEGRYASVGVVSSYPLVNSEMVASDVVPDSLRDILPVLTTDGINEKGLSVCVLIIIKECMQDEAGNVIWQRDGYLPTTGNGNGKPVAQAAIPRYILDNCASVDDAIDKVSRLNVVEPSQGIVSQDCLHFFVSDAHKSASFEWYNNHFIVTEYQYDAKSRSYRSPHGLPAVMTNFYTCKLEEIYREGEEWFEPLFNVHPCAMGMERYDILSKGISEVKTLKQAEEHISKATMNVFYTNTAEEGFWYTENAGFYGPFTEYPGWQGRIDYWNADMDSTFAAYGSFEQQMQHIVGDYDNLFWYTEFSIVYDLKDYGFVIRPQEGFYSDEWLRFTL